MKKKFAKLKIDFITDRSLFLGFSTRSWILTHLESALLLSRLFKQLLYQRISPWNENFWSQNIFLRWVRTETFTCLLNASHVYKNLRKFQFRRKTKSKMNFLKTIRLYSSKVPTNLKGKSKSSQEWLIRQLADPYVERAKVSKIKSMSETFQTNLKVAAQVQ